MSQARQNPVLEPKPPLPLKRERLIRGWSLEEVARAVGTSKRSLCRYEDEGAFPQSLRVVRGLARLYGKTVDELWPEMGEAA